MGKKEPALFGENFLHSFAGKGITTDSKIAIIELIANSWDAGATKVQISWPIEDGDTFSIEDNGHGMNETEFNQRFKTLAYSRLRNQGNFAEIPLDHKSLIGKRPTFGRNGKGRLGGFAFGDFFRVSTWKVNREIIYKVFEDSTNNVAFEKLSEKNKEGHGTKIFVENAVKPKISFDQIKIEIGMRFMTDPNFEVEINNEKITFLDIPEHNINNIDVEVEGLGNIPIIIIDVKDTDKSTHQHGIAWHVNNRLVGECTWRGSGNEHLIDGRRIAAKRYIFIVKADCLSHAINQDWTSFIQSDSKYQLVFNTVQERIKNYLLELSKENREATFNEIEAEIKPVLKSIGYVSREKWVNFMQSIQEECPSISTNDLEKVGRLLANLEKSNSKYSLISILSSSSSEDLDNLNELLQKWDINFAKIVLDEIEYRMQLLEKLKIRLSSNNSDELHDLQPLFHRGLWIFGPEYETIEYTSNEGMTKVIQKLFGNEIKGSKLRPDFAILKDSTVGLYGFPKYDDQGMDVGVDRMTIVELKKPGIPLGDDEINQPWKYVNELFEKGLLNEYTQVICFVLGSELVKFKAERTTKMSGRVIIQPLDFDTVIRRAKSRLLNLYNKVRNSPFLEETRTKEYLKEKEQLELL